MRECGTGEPEEALVLPQVPPERLARANERLRGLRVGDFELVPEGLHLGDARGNRFELTLR
jgi:tRNA(Glu) U13 pseudouridine synthase TruD